MGGSMVVRAGGWSWKELQGSETVPERIVHLIFQRLPPLGPAQRHTGKRLWFSTLFNFNSPWLMQPSAKPSDTEVGRRL